MTVFRDSISVTTDTGPTEVEVFARVRNRFAITRSIRNPAQCRITEILTGYALPADFESISDAVLCADLICEAVPDWHEYLGRLAESSNQPENSVITSLMEAHGGKLSRNSDRVQSLVRKDLPARLKAEGLA